MIVENRFFYWNDQEYINEIKLGDSIDNHVQNGNIIEVEDEDKVYYQLKNDHDISFGQSKGLIDYILFKNEKGNEIIGVDSYKLPYPSTEHVCKHLTKRFKQITDVNSIAQLREEYKGDFLFVSFRDYVPKYLVIVHVS